MKNFILLCYFWGILLRMSVPLQAQPDLNHIRSLAAREKKAWTDVRFISPDGIINNYDLKYHRFCLKVNPALHAVSGSVTSYFVAKNQELSMVQFLLEANMVVDSAYSNSSPAVATHLGDILTIHLNHDLAAGMLDSVTVYYHGSPGSNGFGSFITDLHEDTPVLWTLSEPYGASEWWPSKNDLTDKIDSVDMIVTHPEGTLVASNGILVSEDSDGTGNTNTRWKHRYPIVSYLIAIAVTNYSRFSDTYSSSYGSFEIVNYVYPEDSSYLRKQAQLVLPVLGLFEKLFGPYPFREEKYGQAQFGWGGGMEHQTMTFLGRGAFNHEIIAHELAHQWFGNTVTCGSWQDIWINEGFATYCAGLTYEHMFDGYYWPVWKYQNMSYVTMEPGGSVYCSDTTSVDRIFDSRLSYSKGALVLHMLRWVLGDTAFFNGLNSYFYDPELHFGFARTEDFKRHMEQSSGLDLNWYFSDWIYGEGYPSYRLTCTQHQNLGANISLVQTTSDAAVSFFRLPVPVRFYGDGRDTTIVLNNTYSPEYFYVEPGFKIDSIRIDPDRRIISAGNTVNLYHPEGDYLTINPNPSSQEITVLYNSDKEGTVSVFGMDGRNYVVTIKEKYQGCAVIDISMLPSGSYLLYMDGKKQAGKFVVVK